MSEKKKEGRGDSGLVELMRAVLGASVESLKSDERTSKKALEALDVAEKAVEQRDAAFELLNETSKSMSAIAERLTLANAVLNGVIAERILDGHTECPTLDRLMTVSGMISEVIGD